MRQRRLRWNAGDGVGHRVDRGLPSAMVRPHPPSLNMRGAFTLLEVILTVVLATALLSGLWALSGIYMRMFEAGQDQVEQAQLLRALTQQIDDDLQGVFPGRGVRRGPLPFAFSSAALSQPGDSHSVTERAAPADAGSGGPGTAAVVPPPTDEDSETEPPVTPPAATGEDSFAASGAPANTAPVISASGIAAASSSRSRLPSFSLKGTETSLELTLLRLIPVEEQPAEPINQEALINQNGPPKSPEWRVVKYRFTAPPAEEELKKEPEAPAASTQEKEIEPGLAREDQSWEEFRKSRLAKAMTNATMTEEEIESEEAAPPDGEQNPEETRQNPTGEKKPAEAEETRMNIPQVVALRFQYFDGQTWLSDWDSGAKRSLPQAVEMTLQIKPTLAGEREDRKNEEKKTIPTESTEENEVFHDPGLEKKGNWPAYRQVWVLPAGVDQSSASGRRFPPPFGAERNNPENGNGLETPERKESP